MDFVDDAILPKEWKQFADNMQIFDPREMQRVAGVCNPKLLRQFFSSDMATRSLHEAARLGKSEVMKVILSLKSTNVNRLDSTGQTALHHATREGHLDIVDMLLAMWDIDTNLRDEDGNTSLHIAVERDYVLIFDKILKAPRVDVNITNERGETALVLATRQGYEKIVDMLLEKPNVLDTSEKHKSTPFHAAAMNGHATIVEKLLKKMDVNSTIHSTKKSWLHRVLEGGHKKMVDVFLQGSTTNPSLKDARNGHAIIIEKLPKKMDVNSTTHIGKKSPLHLAVAGKYETVVDVLLQEPTVNFSLEDSIGNTPLHIAAEKGNEAILTKLLQMPKVDVNSANHFTNTALHLAARHKHANIVTKLLEVPKVDPSMKTTKGETPLHMAAKFGAVKVIQVLRTKGKVDVNITDTKKRTAIHWATEQGHFNAMDELLKDPNINPWLGDDNDNTPLHLAAKKGHLRIVEKLLAKCSLDVVNKVNKQKETPLLLATKHGFMNVVDFLLRNFEVDLSICDEYGDSLFHVALKGGHANIAEKLITPPRAILVHNSNKENVTGLHLCIRGGHGNLVDMLLKQPTMDANTKDVYGNFPIHYAAQNGDIDILQRILEVYGMDIKNSANHHLETPLHVAIKAGHVRVVESLLQEPTSDVSMQDRDGNSPLHLAVKYNEEEIIEMLLEADGMDVNAKNNDGLTALVLAAEGGYVPIFYKLLSKVQDVQNIEGGMSAEEGQRKPSKTDWGVQSLLRAARNGHVTIIKSLLAHVRVDVNGPQQFKQFSPRHLPLHMAIKHGHTKVVEVLLDAPNIDPNRLSDNAEHPLFVAAKHGHEKIILMLMNTRKIGINVLSNSKTALHGAAGAGREQVVRTLLNDLGIDVHIKNNDGETALFDAARADNKTILKEIYKASKANIGSEDHTSQTQLNINDMNSKGIGIIHLAAQENLLNVIDFLLEVSHDDAKGVDVNLQTSSPKSQKEKFTLQSALQIAITAQHYTIVEKLTKFDNISFTLEKDGKTILQQIFDQEQWQTFNIVRRTDEVSDYIDALYKDRQASVDAANAILVGAALIAGVTFASWLQPPLGYSTYYHEQFSESLPAPPIAYPEYVAFDHHPSLQAFWVFNSLSFFSAISTVISGARSVLPAEKVFIKEEVEILRWNLLRTSILLGISMFFVLLAFATAGVIVLPPMMKFRANIFSTIAIGGSMCFLFLFLFGRSIYKLRFYIKNSQMSKKGFFELDIKSHQISKKGFFEQLGFKLQHMPNPFTRSME